MQAKQVLLQCPQLLAEKEFELQRKWQWLQDVLGCDKAAVLACPHALALGLMRVRACLWSWCVCGRQEAN